MSWLHFAAPLTALLALLAGALRPESRFKALPQSEGRLPLLPYPAELELGSGGVFMIHPGVDVKLGKGISEDAPAVVGLRELLAGSGSGSSDTSVTLRLAGEAAPNSTAAQRYRLAVTAKTVNLEAPSLEGLFYGVQTLRQLAMLPKTAGNVPALTITDAPRFTWRGLHLDVSRHFFSADEVKRLLDVMSLYKLNRFQWHLTDDQGWRLPVDGYPLLTKVAGDGKAYTKQEIRDVVAYAQARHIEILPEIDVPGHVQAALAAYPDLGNTDVPDWRRPTGPMNSWGISEYTLGPKDATFNFLGKVFDTVDELFPFKVVHMGGDEVMTGEWSQSPAAVSFLGGHAAKDSAGDAVARVFGQKLVDLVKDRGHRIAAWNEAQHTGSFPKDGIVFAWQGQYEARVAVQAGRTAVVADMGTLYFDHAQASSGEPEDQGGCSDWRMVHKYEIMPEELTAEQKRLVLGAQGQLWSEYFPIWSHVEYMAHPRSLALAENTWTPKASRGDEEDFRRRLAVRLGDLDRLGANYSKDLEKRCDDWR